MEILSLIATFWLLYESYNLSTTIINNKHFETKTTASSSKSEVFGNTFTLVMGFLEGWASHLLYGEDFWKLYLVVMVTKIFAYGLCKAGILHENFLSFWGFIVFFLGLTCVVYILLLAASAVLSIPVLKEIQEAY